MLVGLQGSDARKIFGWRIETKSDWISQHHIILIPLELRSISKHKCLIAENELKVNQFERLQLWSAHKGDSARRFSLQTAHNMSPGETAQKSEPGTSGIIRLKYFH